VAALLRTYQAGEGPEEIVALAMRLIPQLIQGEHPTLAILRQQFESVRIGPIELSGVGFFAHLQVPPDKPTATPPDFAGGDALIELAGSTGGAGCVLFVKDGCLSMLEGYTRGGDDWPEDAVVLDVKDVISIHPG
jgi:hypothetical protein